MVGLYRARIGRHLIIGFITLGLIWSFPGTIGSAAAAQKKGRPSVKPSAAAAVALRYAEALSSGDRATAGQLDFACQYAMVTAGAAPLKAFPPASDPVYAACWNRLEQVHQTALDLRNQGMDAMWPGKNGLVFFREPLDKYGASFFVMDVLGLSPPAGGLKLDVVESKPMPAASFRLRENGPVLGAPTTLVTLRVTYKDPLSSPVAYAPGSYKFTNTVKRPRAAIKAVLVQWVVLSGLKKAGLPGDTAVANLPVSEREGARVPFVTETSRYVDRSATWFGPTDAPGTLIAAVARAALFPDLQDRVAMFNRVLIVDPGQPDALTALTHDLYQTLLAAGAAAHKFPFNDPALAARFNELYWDIYSQTTRMDISLSMEIGGLAQPTPADYLYRIIPAMEMLAKVRPEDLENRLRLGVVYRWNNDQLAAINTHEALVKALPVERYQPRTRALIELAWSRIAKVSWNRIFDDPNIAQAYQEAQEAYKFTDRPLDKFVSAYTMAYSLAFMPQRDNQAMLDLLTEAKRWYLELDGATDASWRYLLGNDTLKGVLEADPLFKPLLAGT
ncbi:MAG: hypothetical protein KGN30_01635 [Nitrospirota bacterium]|nr:hypothetical protein [Nitrospirota bacterium]